MNAPLPDLASLVRATDHLRGSSARLNGVVGHKEWFHFNVSTATHDALLNFALVDDVAPDGTHRGTQPRVTWLLHAPVHGWRGEVLTPDPRDVSALPGSVGLRLGAHAFAFRDGAYRIALTGERHDVAFDLALTPTTVPTSFHNVDLGDGPPLHWLIVPRLRASGGIEVDGVRHEVRGAPAYHDHNWGQFRWGGDYAWEWGYVHDPADAPGWSFVFSRMNDRAYHSTRRVGLMVWRGHLQRRVFFGGAITVRREGVLRTERLLKLPPVMGLARGGTHTSVPARFMLEARQGDDHVRIVVTPRDAAQILVPSEDVVGLTAIHEVVSDVEVDACLLGERVSFTSRAVVEYLGG